MPLRDSAMKTSCVCATELLKAISHSEVGSSTSVLQDSKCFTNPLGMGKKWGRNTALQFCYANHANLRCTSPKDFVHFLPLVTDAHKVFGGRDGRL